MAHKVNDLRKKLSQEKILKTRSKNELNRLRPLVEKQRKALAKVQTNKKMIEHFRDEISRIGQIRKQNDRLRERLYTINSY